MNNLTRPLIVVALAIFLYAVYLPGVGGALYYDDYANLRLLSSLGDGTTLAEFVFGGEAGPLGRPISLLSFVPHAAGWPNNAASILHVNILLHVANMLLLFAIARLTLGLLVPGRDATNFRIAASAAVLWGVLPLLASTSLIAIQRMTSLAAFFGLLGLLGFLWGYRYSVRAPKTALVVQLGLLGVGSLLAAFSKENGLLIPIFALLIDVLLLRHVPYDQKHRLLLRAVLFVCLAIPLYYISPLQRDWFAVNDFREFSPWDRLQSQWVFLWEYLQRGFMPVRPTASGPFQDHYDIVRDPWVVWTAFAGWCAALAGALLLRRLSVLPLFALLWFFAGHLLESTTVTLELVFEHRNYLAVYGFCLMLAWFAWTVSGNLKRIAPLLFGAYVGMLAAITFTMTSLWGNPSEAAHMWAEKNPGSARAALHLAFVEVGAPDDQLESRDEALRQQGLQRALFVLDRTARICPECLDVRLQALIYSCQLTEAADTRERYRQAYALAEHATVNMAIVDAFFPLHQLVSVEACQPLEFADLLALSERLIENERSKFKLYRSRLHFIAAMNAQSLGDSESMRTHLSNAERVDVKALPVLQFQVYSAIEDARFDDALAAIERRRPYAVRGGGSLTHEFLDELQSEVDRVSDERGG